VIGERVRLARSAAGLSQRGLAEKVGVSAQAISKYERNEDIPSSGVLLRLARALGVKTEYFFRPVEVVLSQPEYRKRKAMKKKTEKMILGQVRDCLERRMQIEGILDKNRASKFELPEEVSCRIKSMADVEKVSEKLRLFWKLGFDPIDDLSETLEEHGIKIIPVSAEQSFDACTFWVNGEVPVIAVNKEFPGDRQRFSLAHELGHLVLKKCEIDEEKTASRFAGAFLAPASAVVNELGKRRSKLSIYELHLLKHKYGLSMQAWIYRARDLNVISESAAKNLFKEFRARGWHIEEPGEQLRPEKNTRFERLVARALEEELISKARAAELLGMPVAKLGEKIFYNEQ